MMSDIALVIVGCLIGRMVYRAGVRAGERRAEDLRDEDEEREYDRASIIGAIEPEPHETLTLTVGEVRRLIFQGRRDEGQRWTA